MSALADKIVAGVGSWAFVISFTVVTALWVIAKFFGIDKDFSIFTWFLSVLAIYLTVFILISQNKEQKQFAAWILEDIERGKKLDKKLDAIKSLLKEKK